MTTRARLARIWTGRNGLLAGILLLSPAACLAAPQTFTVVIGGQPLMTRPAPFLEDGQVWAPADAAAKAMAAKLTPAGPLFKVGTGEASAPRKLVDGRELVAIEELARACGAEPRRENKTLSVFARVTDVRFAQDAIRIATSIPVAHQTRRLTGPERIYIDLKGARIAGGQTESRSARSVVRALRLGQYDPETVRVTAETAGRLVFAVQSPPRAAQVVVALSGAANPKQADSAASGTQASATGGTAAPAAATSGTAAPASSEPVEIRQVRVQSTDESARFTITADRPPGPELKMDSLRNRLTLQFDRATVSAPDRSWRFTDGPVQGAMLVAGGFAPSAVALTVTGSRPLASRVLAGQSPNEIIWEVTVPRDADGDWHTKTVVIDAGHGGKDSGARGNGLLEKDINLAVALAVKGEAARRGLPCVLTRSTDVYLTLKQRADTSAARGASVFVSIHSNSNGRPNSVSGMEVYYHKQDPSSRMLAQLAHDEIVRATGIPGRGARSDLKLYQTGLYVLRNATVPAILVEMGYMNHASDAKRLADTDFQQHTAEAIVDAVIRYLGGPGENQQGTAE